MHRHILTLAFCGPFVVVSARAQEASSLSAEDLKAIVAKPHDDKLILKGLEVLPNVQNWNAVGHFIDPQGNRQPFKGKTTSKRVDGKYEVSRTLFEGHRVALTFVTTWDPKSDTYYKYTVTARGAPSKSIGMRVPNTNSIAWATIGGGPEMLTRETYDAKKMTWRSLMIDKAGGVTLITDGEATPAEE